MKPKHITTEANVEAYEATDAVFSAVHSEMRELSKKKPDATLTAAKRTIVNPVLDDLRAFLRHEPEGKHLELLADDALQVSDALLHMAPFKAALDAFRSRYTAFDDDDDEFWLTPERIAEKEAEGALDDDDDDGDDGDDDGGGPGDGGDDGDDDDDDDDDEKEDVEPNRGKRWQHWRTGPSDIS